MQHCCSQPWPAPGLAPAREGGLHLEIWSLCKHGQNVHHFTTLVMNPATALMIALDAAATCFNN